MDAVGRGIIAGFIATLIISAAFHPIAYVARSADALPATFGWLLHFMVGSLIWGAGFALLYRLIPGALWIRGILFGIGAWFIVMLLVLPLTRAGLFGLELGLPAPALMLVVHLAYGALLGVMFGLLDPDGGAKRAPDAAEATVDEQQEDRLHPLPR
jgi:hypothetical protein